MNDRTLTPRINDTWQQWLDRLVNGTRWEERTVGFTCLECGHASTEKRPWSPNNSTATNFVTITFHERRRFCSKCGSDIVMADRPGKNG